MPPEYPQLFAVVVGGGSGTRFGADRPKQFVPLAGKPILVHTLERFLRYSDSLRIVLVLPVAYISYWQAEQTQYLSPEDCKRITLAPGGNTRTGSVYNGLKALGQHIGIPTENQLVAIQDAVRPFANPELLTDAFASAAEHGSGIAAVPSKSSLRRKTDTGSVAVDRSEYYAVQTPQVFQLPLLWDSYQRLAHKSFTDDASLVEAAGHPVHLVMGSYDNLKITTPEDLALAELILTSYNAKWR